MPDSELNLTYYSANNRNNVKEILSVDIRREVSLLYSLDHFVIPAEIFVSRKFVHFSLYVDTLPYCYSHWTLSLHSFILDKEFSFHYSFVFILCFIFCGTLMEPHVKKDASQETHVCAFKRNSAFSSWKLYVIFCVGYVCVLILRQSKFMYLILLR